MYLDKGHIWPLKMLFSPRQGPYMYPVRGEHRGEQGPYMYHLSRSIPYPPLLIFNLKILSESSKSPIIEKRRIKRIGK